MVVYRGHQTEDLFCTEIKTQIGRNTMNFTLLILIKEFIILTLYQALLTSFLTPMDTTQFGRLMETPLHS